ncbi:MAG: hypothetical protein WDW38_003211 [Sanguina aurantia]
MASNSSALRRSVAVEPRDVFSENQLRYAAYRSDYKHFEAFSRLQAAAVAFGESLPIPEIVAIGGQSDGKSSLLEAFLGFRFNVREVEMGTRRPLIVQMIHDPTAQEPRCRLQEEDSDEYGPPIIPETAVADAIMKRTEEHLRRLGGAAVSSKPIVMRAEYAFCPNLTIIDTPGFVLKAKNGEADNTPEEIMNMVKAQAAPPHRMILFLQQSSVEWASSLWLRVIQEVDPHFQRAVIVASKFDNRLKEFGERWEVDKYLSATGYLPAGVRPFFVALPKDRNIQTSAEWRRAMGGFDEERYASRIGFASLKRFLEEELSRRYREAAPATLAVLQERCDAVSSELAAADVRLRATADVASLRRAAMLHAHNMGRQVDMLLGGSSEPDPAVHGMTTDEERAASRLLQWPSVQATIRPPHGGLKLFGGAAFERCLSEFQEAAHALRFPSGVARDKVANVLLAYKGKNTYGGPAKAAEDIARQTARELLGPILDMSCSRLAYVLRRVFEIAADRAMVAGGSKDTLQPYVAYHAALRSAHMTFVNKLEEKTRATLRQALDSATSEFAINVMSMMPDPASDDDGEEAQPIGTQPAGGEEQGVEGVTAGIYGLLEATAPRPAHRGSRLTVPETPSPHSLMANLQNDLTKRAAFGGVGKPHIDNSPSKPRTAKSHRMEVAPLAGPGSYDDVIRYAERLFRKIRQAVAQQAAPTVLKSSFLDPVNERLHLDVQLELFARPDAEFMSLFNAAGAVAALQTKRDALQRRVDGLMRCKNEFSELAKLL